MPKQTPESTRLDARVAVLWPLDLSAAEIGRQVGITKHAVLGRAHRMDLPPRPSPIRGRTPASERRRSVRKPGRATLAALASVIVIGSGMVDAPLYARVTECCFPIGDPGTEGFRYCDLPTLPAKVYCGLHHKLCYTKGHIREPNAPDPSTTPSRFSFQRHDAD